MRTSNGTAARLTVALSILLVLAIGVGTAAARGGPNASARRGEIGPSLLLTANGRHLAPAGRMTQVGDFPTGAALTRDSRFSWVVDSGHGHDDVKVVSVGSGAIVQTLPLPGAYGGIAFSPDGKTAYVSGEPRGNITPEGPTVANTGDAIHVFSVDQQTGKGTELAPIQLPATSGGYAQVHEGGTLGWPEGVTVTPNGTTLLVALNQADALAIVDLTKPSHPTRLVHVGSFPYGVAASRDSHVAFVSNELDGTVSVVDIAHGTVVSNIGVGGTRGDQEAHPEGMVVDRHHPVLYVAVTNRDLVAVIDTQHRRLTRLISVGRTPAIGTAPLALAQSADGATLYVADSGEDAIAVIALVARHKYHAFTTVGRIPTAAYPSDVEVTGDGSHVVWTAAKGLGAGPNPDYAVHFANSEAAPYGSYVIDKLLGEVGVLRTPTPGALIGMTHQSDRQVRPLNWEPAPKHTVVVGANGGPSGQIKHVFYVVRENRTYDQVFGSDPRGDGAAGLEVVDDNGVPGPTGGVTPNAHALSNRFPLLDHVYADSEVSTDGHVITSSSYAIDFVQKALHADYSSRGRVNFAGQSPETYPPNYFVFDRLASDHIGFANFGEFSAGLSNDGRATYPAVTSALDFSYPIHFGCDGTYPTLSCSTDSGHVGQTGSPTTSRFDHFQQRFNTWLTGGVDHVPSFVYLTLPNDHTNGVSAGHPTPKAMVADNDYGLGQLVQLISHSSIWHESAIFVIEDDSQDGADHVDAHRMPAFVISPYAKHGVVHTRYDQYSVLRTAEMILGAQPLSLDDALATPMYDAFTTQADLKPYVAVKPQQSLTETNPLTPAPAAPKKPGSSTTGAAAHALASKLPFDKVDLVPQSLSDQVLWHSVFGWDSTPPLPGPDASPQERERAQVALDAFEQHRSLTDALQRWGSVDDDG